MYYHSSLHAFVSDSTATTKKPRKVHLYCSENNNIISSRSIYAFQRLRKSINLCNVNATEVEMYLMLEFQFVAQH